MDSPIPIKSASSLVCLLVRDFICLLLFDFHKKKCVLRLPNTPLISKPLVFSVPPHSCRWNGRPSGGDRQITQLPGGFHAFLAWSYATCPASTASSTLAFAEFTIFCARCFRSLAELRT